MEMILIYVLSGGAIIYVLLTLYFAYLVHQVSRKPVKDMPDWGTVIDTRIPAAGGGSLEVWRVEPEGRSRGIVVLAHGWSRNRDRMVGRARIFGKMGFTTVMHSARDHGRSSPYRFMNAPRFAEDIGTVLDWVKEPVLLYGHSVGAAAAVIEANRNPRRIKLLFLEGCYAKTKEALLSLYRGYNRVFGMFFAPMVVWWMDVFYRHGLDSISPTKLASGIDLPVLIIHGEKDQNFPPHHVRSLKNGFPAGRAEVFIAKDTDHSSSSLQPEYPTVIREFVDRRLRS